MRSEAVLMNKETAIRSCRGVLMSGKAVLMSLRGVFVTWSPWRLAMVSAENVVSLRADRQQSPCRPPRKSAEFGPQVWFFIRQREYKMSKEGEMSGRMGSRMRRMGSRMRCMGSRMRCMRSRMGCMGMMSEKMGKMSLQMGKVSILSRTYCWNQ